MAEQDLSRNEARPGRALVLVASAQPETPRAFTAPNAAFVAQLLACRAGVPAYRERRRAEPAAAARCYRQALTLVA